MGGVTDLSKNLAGWPRGSPDDCSEVVEAAMDTSQSQSGRGVVLTDCRDGKRGSLGVSIPVRPGVSPD